MSTTSSRRHVSSSFSRRYSYLHVVGAFLVGCAVSCLVLTFYLTGQHRMDELLVGGGGGGNGGKTTSSAMSMMDKVGVHQIAGAGTGVGGRGGASVASKTSSQNQKQLNKQDEQQFQPRIVHDEHHPVAGLDCLAHGGAPTDPKALSEMVYWRDIPQDNRRISSKQAALSSTSSTSSDWRSPFNRRLWKVDDDHVDRQSQQLRQYLTFEPDGGGFNNIRMSLETVITMAVAMGRVLVLPPSQKMYLLGKSALEFGNFFPLQALAKEHLDGVGLEIITTDEFLQEMAQSNEQDIRQKLQEHPIPENGRTQWDGDTQAVKNTLNPWLRQVGTAPGEDWDPRFCIAAFPQSSDSNDIDELRRILQEVIDDEIASNTSLGGAAKKKDNVKELIGNIPDSYVNNPTPVNATTKQRLREFLAGRDKLCIYDQRLQNASIIHFHGKAVNKKHQSVAKQQELEGGGGRLLVHFYAFLFFQDYRAELWMKRFARDHIRYKDEIQCAGARVIEAVRQIARQNNQAAKGVAEDGSFDAFHVRRGDFQYKKTRVSAEELIEMAKDEIPVGRTVYIGTDERNKLFFKPLKDHGWNLLFLDDFIEKGLLENIDSHYYGMIDQLITSRSDVFFGCWFSTFTGFITRIRGYHSQRLDDGTTNRSNEVATAHAEGKLPKSYYYALQEHKTKLHDYWPIKQAFYAREFPTSWWRLDWDVEMHTRLD